MTHLTDALTRTDWPLLATQKQALISACARDPRLDGLLNWLDTIQDAADLDGWPVVFLSATRKKP